MRIVISRIRFRQLRQDELLGLAALDFVGLVFFCLVGVDIDVEQLKGNKRELSNRGAIVP